MIHEMKTRHPSTSMDTLCRSLGVSRQAHHKHACRTGHVAQGRGEVVQRVHELRSRMPRLGGRKLYHELRPEIDRLAVPFGRDRFFDLLREERLLIRTRRRQVRTTMSRHGLPVYPDLVKGLAILRPGQVWVSDITYWRVEDGFYFIFLITDACSKKIIGYQVAQSMDGDHAMFCLHKAMKESIHPLEGIIHHSDRGSQYCYARYVKALKGSGMLVSMTEDSDPRDNAIAERLNGILKSELLAHHTIGDIAQAKAVLNEAVRIYNEERPHLSCDMLKPEQAHQLATKLPQRWKSYHRSVNPTQDELSVVNPTQELRH